MESYKDLIEDLANLQFDYKFKPDTKTLKNNTLYKVKFMKAIAQKLKEEGDSKNPEYAHLTHEDNGNLFYLLGDLHDALANDDKDKYSDCKQDVVLRLIRNVSDYTGNVVNRDIYEKLEELESKTPEELQEKAYWDRQRILPQSML